MDYSPARVECIYRMESWIWIIGVCSRQYNLLLVTSNTTYRS
jgi:hypothetical protein